MDGILSKHRKYKYNIYLYINMNGEPRVTLYYADWCGHCQRFKPEWNKFKSSSKGIICEEYEDSQLQRMKNPLINGKPIQGFPTIKIEVNNREYEYDGERDAKSLKRFVDKLSGQQGGSMIDPYESKYKKYKAKYLALKEMIKK